MMPERTRGVPARPLSRSHNPGGRFRDATVPRARLIPSPARDYAPAAGRYEDRSLAISWIFSSATDFHQLSGFHQLDGSSFFSGLDGHNWFTLYIGYAFLLTWNVIAMEAAACYIGECRDPERDAKIAMNLEGGYGLFIYTLIPIAFIVVLGASATRT